MKKFLEMLTEEMQQAFTAAGYDGKLGKVMLSNRPDLCEYQCNGAMAGAKLYKKAPIMIANDVAEKLADSKVFSEVVAVAPGFLNLKVSEAFLLTYLQGMEANEKFGLEKPELCFFRAAFSADVTALGQFLLDLHQVFFLQGNVQCCADGL